MAGASSRRHPPAPPTTGLRRRQQRQTRLSPRVVDIQPCPPSRLLAVFVLILAALSGLAGRLFWLQIVEGHNLLARARSIQTQSINPIGERRTVVDRMGRLIAIDEERFTLWAHPRYFNLPGDPPQQVRTPSDIADRLAVVLARPSQTLVDLMGTHKTGVKLATNLDPETAAQVRKLGISGLDLEPYPQRVYPQGGLFANVVGFLNLERQPQAGLELSRDADLHRQESRFNLRRGADGTPLPDGLAAGSLYEIGRAHV